MASTVKDAIEKAPQLPRNLQSVARSAWPQSLLSVVQNTNNNAQTQQELTEAASRAVNAAGKPATALLQSAVAARQALLSEVSSLERRSGGKALASEQELVNVRRALETCANVERAVRFDAMLDSSVPAKSVLAAAKPFYEAVSSKLSQMARSLYSARPASLPPLNPNASEIGLQNVVEAAGRALNELGQPSAVATGVQQLALQSRFENVLSTSVQKQLLTVKQQLLSKLKENKSDVKAAFTQAVESVKNLNAGEIAPAPSAEDARFVLFNSSSERAALAKLHTLATFLLKQKHYLLLRRLQSPPGAAAKDANNLLGLATKQEELRKEQEQLSYQLELLRRIDRAQTVQPSRWDSEPRLPASTGLSVPTTGELIAAVGPGTFC